MDVRRVKLALWGTTAAGLAVAVAAPLSLRLPYDVAPPSKSTPTASTQASPTTAPKPLPALSAFDSIAELDLRRPLFDQPPAPTPVAAPVVKPPLTVKLVGLVVESGNSLAILVTADGKTQLKASGERCGDVEVLSITEQGARIRFGGEERLLVLEREGRG